MQINYHNWLITFIYIFCVEIAYIKRLSHDILAIVSTRDSHIKPDSGAVEGLKWVEG